MVGLHRYEDDARAREILMQFYREVYPDAPWQLDHSRFEWQNLKNPLQKPGETEIWVLADDSGKFVGHNNLILYRLIIGGRAYMGFCSTNLIVRPGLVGKGIGHKLIENNEQRGGVAYAVGITPASIRAFQKRGWVFITDARMFTRIVNPGPNLRYLGISGWKALLAAPALKIAGLVHSLLSALRVPRTLPGVSVSEIERFSPEHDDLWRQYLKNYAIHFDRDARQLNYKFASRTDLKHTILLFEKEGRPVGYGVCRLSENPTRPIRLGRIVDLVADPGMGEDLITYMIAVMRMHLASHQVDAFVGVAANPAIASAYRRNGFYLSRVQASIIKETDFRIEELQRAYPTLWYITLGDSDLDNYW